MMFGDEGDIVGRVAQTGNNEPIIGVIKEVRECPRTFEHPIS
jgi:hypothetical protein